MRIEFLETGSEERPPESGVPGCQRVAQTKLLTLEYLSSLDIRSEPLSQWGTHIVCNIGTNTTNLEQLIEAGMRIAVVKCHENTAELIKKLREAANNFGKRIQRMYPLGIALETWGCASHIGGLQGGWTKLNQGDPITLSTEKELEDKGNSEQLYVDYPNMCDICPIGTKIHLDDGVITLTVREVIGANKLNCTVDVGGELNGYELISFPGASEDLPLLSTKDKNDILFGTKQHVDFIFASFVQSVEVIRNIREVLGEAGRKIMVVSKIENVEGFDNVDEIIKASDAILLARDRLTLHIAPEKIIIAQKTIAATCNLKNKPIACSGMVMESMVQRSQPLRAEVTDVANAVMDGYDMVVLSQEVCESQFCLDTVKITAAICCEAEACFSTRYYLRNVIKLIKDKVDPERATAMAAVKTSLKTEAAAIIVLTRSGHSAWSISQMRPRCPILAVTRSGTSARQMWLRRGVIPLYYLSKRPENTPWTKDVDARLQYAINFGKKSGFIKKNDAIILITGWRFGKGFTNTVRLVYATETAV